MLVVFQHVRCLHVCLRTSFPGRIAISQARYLGPLDSPTSCCFLASAGLTKRCQLLIIVSLLLSVLWDYVLCVFFLFFSFFIFIVVRIFLL